MDFANWAGLRGRDQQIANLQGALERTVNGATVVLIEGAPGAGKTALCAALVQEAVSRGFGMVAVHGVEGESDLPLAGLSALLRPLTPYLDQLPVAHQQTMRAALGESNHTAPDRFAIGVAVLELLAAAAASQRLLVVVDDAQWLDSVSADALSFALQRLHAETVAVVLAARDSGCAVTLPASRELVEIAGLDVDAVAAMLVDANLAVSPAVARLIHAGTAGLPLAVLETAASLTADQRAGETHLPDPLPVGRQVLDAYRARLVALPSRSRVAIATLAAAGSAPSSMVYRAFDMLGVDKADWESAEDVGVIKIAESGPVFSHPLYRAAALACVSPARRRSVHSALAQAAHAEPERRARHLVAAGVGPSDDIAAELEEAARHARHRGGEAAAAPILMQAADFSEPGERRCRRFVIAARALSRAGRMRAAVRCADQAMAEATDPVLRMDAAFVKISTQFWGSHPEIVEELARDLAERMADVDPARTIRALVHAACALTTQGRLSSARTLTSRACDLIDPAAQSQTDVMALHLHAATLANTGDAVRAGDILDQYPPRRRADGYGPHAGTVIQTLVRLERFTAADALARSLVAGCRKDVAPAEVAFPLAAAAELRWWLGRWSRAVDFGEEAYLLASQTGQENLAWHIRASVARALAGQGREEECRAYVAGALAAAQSVGLRPLRIYALSAAGFLDLGLGRPEMAIPALQEADELFRACGARNPIIVPFAPDLIEALIRVGDRTGAWRVIEEQAELAEASRSQWAMAVIERGRGMLARSPDEADKHFRRALAVTPTDVPFDAARTYLCWGEQLRRRRMVVEGRSVLSKAAAAFDMIGAAPWSRRAREELCAAGGGAPKVVTPLLELLPSQERRCAELAASGLTYRQIANELVISSKTVDYRLQKVYRAFGIHSRAELAPIVLASSQGPASPENRNDQNGPDL